MSPLFRKSEKRLAQEAAAKAEFEHLCALPVPELAAEILPTFGPDAKRPVHTSLGASRRLMERYGGVGVTYLRGLEQPMEEAIQALEHASLLTRKVRSYGSGNTEMLMYITRLGETALAEGNVRRYLEPGGTT